MQVFCIDHWPNRFEKVQALGAEPINFDELEPVETIKSATKVIFTP
jgi:hypothetical protein